MRGFVVAYSDNKVEDVAMRSILYITDKALNYPFWNQSRGMVIDQLLRFMGFRPEHLRPDAPSYIQATREPSVSMAPSFFDTQLQWPFDPESVTIPAEARNWYQLTQYCLARNNADIGAGQRAGLLTRWDAIKINSTYCPSRVVEADRRYGPCVVPRLHSTDRVDNSVKKTKI
ncbi:unnamed protein product [Toxocara canis]|uniref:Peptidase_M13 domain-containing protein n=1 Tax=Toxocara canis TaxID=6265 RepID=A0A183UTQ4_TOXCA|nr:unnamed protein product [Toxocara canis]